MPIGKVRHDDRRAAVARLLAFSRQRVEAGRTLDCLPHYGLEALYCRPGTRGAHEKGSVEDLTFGGNIIETGPDSHRLATTRPERNNGLPAEPRQAHTH
ncbi:hypothetical protein [Streptomyces sp. NPDC093514]|uniref:hypothetical protein n=1 Tax=Streptomyces sp. NPDC093514 TaxID=3366039 RepID=UPI0038022C24